MPTLTLQQAKDQYQTDIRSKVSINSISPDNVADMGDTGVTLVLERGLYLAASTSVFATLTGTEAQICLVENVGIFKYASSGPAANGSTVFDGPSGSKWIRVLQTNQTGAAIALNDLSDVTITDPQPGDAILFTGSQYVNSPLPGGPVVTESPQIMSLAALTSTKIRVTFNKKMQYSNSNGIAINDGAPNAITAIEGSGTDTIDLTVANTMQNTDVITFAYDSTLGDLRDMSNVELASTTSPLAVNNMIEGGGGAPGGGGSSEGTLFS